MKKVLVLVVSMAVMAGLLAPSGAAAKRSRVPAKPSAAQKAVMNGVAVDVAAAVDEAVACARAATDGETGATAAAPNPAVLACVRTAVQKIRAIVNRAIDDMESSNGDLGASGKSAFQQIRMAIAVAFDRIEAQLGAAG